ncbi:hypothetical protein [Burkholderia sp. Bp9099]|uniref:hypothetical protein n=1 Tax=Burkholderia sp. Bp9099 TaxID=2184568 RepID=UPI000F5DC30F|nr:hypothetical protein [Burkholderia sp. Bp9099]
MENLPQHFQGENEITLGNRIAILVASAAEFLSTPLALSISNEMLPFLFFSRFQLKKQSASHLACLSRDNHSDHKISLPI